VTVARIVAAMAMVHNPRITGAPDAATPEAAHRVHAAYDALRQDLVSASPDWALVITNEHMNNPFFPYMPPFSLGIAPKFQSIPEMAAGLPGRTVPSDEAISTQLLETAWQRGFDLAYSYDLLLDHGTMVPLNFLTPQLDLPIVHIHQATSRGPRPPLRRCYQLGGLLRAFVEARPAAERVALIGTGGLSHWAGTPRMGQVNAAWDQRVLRLLEERGDEELLAMTDVEIEAAGNGAHEIRNWITVAGVVPDAPAEIVGYEEFIPPWMGGGTAHVRFRL
jgi:hypothetical protein